MRYSATLLAVAFLSVPVLGQSVLGQTNPNPHTTFFRANALYAEGQYSQSVALYEDLVADGYESGHLRFNLGNAYFKAGDPGRAILNYTRAERWIPGDPDLVANLSYARSQTGAAACEDPFWAQLAFPLADRFASWTLALATLTLVSLGLLLLAAGRLWPTWKRPLRTTAAVSFVLFFGPAGSLGYRVFTVDMPDKLVVVQSGQSPVRFEPDDAGTTHYSTQQGESLRLEESRDGWYQVARCDGRRGWIAARAVERL